MSENRKPQIYKDLIDSLVEVCCNGQGQIGPFRAREGVWNRNASAEFIPEQHKINLFLARISATDREVLARLLASQVEVGIFETLKVLERHEISPFEDGYEGSPYHDFIGRLTGWEWPD